MLSRPVEACLSPSSEELEANRRINEKDEQARKEAKEAAKKRREERKRNQMMDGNDAENQVILEEIPDLEDVPDDIAIDLAQEIAEENDAELQNILGCVTIGRSRRSREIRPSIRLQESLELQ